eukprot:jgi/Bigna1/57537/fgenesh1_pm.18_\
MPLVEALSLAAKDTTGVFTCMPIERRAPKANDVLINITHCGICHSDLHQVRGEWPMPQPLPYVGEVVDVGADVKKFKKGDKVGVGCMVDSCLDCTNCKAGVEQYCCGSGWTGTYNAVIKLGENIYGGYSTAITVREEFVLRVPDNLPLVKAGPLLCAGITVYSPLVNFGAKKGGKTFHTAIVGFGGLGHMAVKIAKAMGNTVTVISRGTKKTDAAKKCGADNFVDSKNADEFKKATGQFDLIINTIAANHPVRAYMSLLKFDGTMCMVGIPPDTFQMMAFDLIMGRKKLAGSLIGGIKETQEMLDFCSKHKITPDTELIAAKDVNKAYHELSTGANDASRFVIDMATLTKADSS